MAPKLFTPVDLGPVRLPNRIVVSPMCQYSADDGCADPDWHRQHLTQLGYSGAGLVVIEATAVERIGRITHGDLGLYSDANEAALGRVLASARRFAMPGTRFGVQLAHAGRKASTAAALGRRRPAPARPGPLGHRRPLGHPVRRRLAHARGAGRGRHRRASATPSSRPPAAPSASAST